MRSKLATGTLSILVLLTAFAGCQLVAPRDQVTTSPTPNPAAMTCAAWLDIANGDRVALADQLVGGSGDLLERIRVRQHQPEGTQRDSLIRDVVTSLTKNCEVWPPPTRTVGEVMDALY